MSRQRSEKFLDWSGLHGARTMRKMRSWIFLTYHTMRQRSPRPQWCWPVSCGIQIVYIGKFIRWQACLWALGRRRWQTKHWSGLETLNLEWLFDTFVSFFNMFHLFLCFDCFASFYGTKILQNQGPQGYFPKNSLQNQTIELLLGIPYLRGLLGDTGGYWGNLGVIGDMKKLLISSNIIHHNIPLVGCSIMFPYLWRGIPCKG